MTSYPYVSQLTELLGRVNLGLERADDGFVVTYERERHPLPALPCDDIADAVRDAELLAIAAGIDAAVKNPAQLAPGEALREGAATLLPRVERRRFLAAYDAVLAGRGGGDDRERLFFSELGAGLVTCYVLDGGWRFSWLARGRVDSWGASPGTIHSVARSNLYARHEVDHRAPEVAIGDGYDAARVALIEDVFYDRVGAAGLAVALPCRDRLLLGPDLDPAAVAAAYAEADYPLSPAVLTYEGGQLTAR
ncbi:MAG: hypothetical protein CSA66_06985 [Proteobacteria bacterium]|nr:MAG: hypothetical protein CSA66_06985 [Pseudomonadota bacterium]